MKYIKSFKVFENTISTQTNSPAGAIPGQAPSSLATSTGKNKNFSRTSGVGSSSSAERNLSYDSPELSEPAIPSIPRNYKDFEKLITKKFEFKIGESTSVNEGGGIGLLVFGTVLL